MCATLFSVLNGNILCSVHELFVLFKICLKNLEILAWFQDLVLQSRGQFAVWLQWCVLVLRLVGKLYIAATLFTLTGLRRYSRWRCRPMRSACVYYIVGSPRLSPNNHRQCFQNLPPRNTDPATLLYQNPQNLPLPRKLLQVHINLLQLHPHQRHPQKVIQWILPQRKCPPQFLPGIPVQHCHLPPRPKSLPLPTHAR